LRVLFVTGPAILARGSGGGLYIQMMQTIEELEKIGIEAVLYNPWKSELEECDICHIMGSDPSVSQFAVKARSLGKPVVVSTVWLDSGHPEYMWKFLMWASNHVKGASRVLRQKKLLFDNADLLLALNRHEKKALGQVFRQNPDKIRIIPNGRPAHFEKISDSEQIFRKKFGIEGYILCVAVISDRKNQRILIEAVNELPYKLVIIGKSPVGMEKYEVQCKAIADPDKVLFCGEINNEDPLLVSAYKSAKVFALMSRFEVQPLVFVEAAMMGCQILTSNRVCAHPGFERYTTRVNHTNKKDVSDALISLMENDIKKGDIIDCSHRNIITWQQAAQDIYKCYENLM